MPTILVTDLVGSTRMTQALGTERYQQLQGNYEQSAAEACAAHGGSFHEVIDPGDGIVAIFEAAVDAVLGAQGTMEAAEATGLQTRAGLHVCSAPVTRAHVTDTDRICGHAAAGESAMSAAVIQAIPSLAAHVTPSAGVDLSTGPSTLYLLRTFLRRDDLA